VTLNRLVVGAVALLAVVIAFDAVRGGGDDGERGAPIDGFRIDLASSRDGTWHPPASLRAAFPGDVDPPSVAISKVAVAPDDVVAIAVSHVTGVEPGRAAIQLWEGDRLVRAFDVPPGSFSRGLWFAGDGKYVATIGWNGRGYLYDRDGRSVRGTAYFAYETR
jgi:hypothetical protein